MPDLPKKKVGLISCSGEELPEGTVTRRAVRRVLETLRPEDTVTLCLPLFLAGGEGERAFARHYPTIAVDGCAKRCAALATEKYSAAPAAGIVVSEVAAETGGDDADLGTPRHLSEAGLALSETVALRIADETDKLLRKPKQPAMSAAIPTCSCGSARGLPSGILAVHNKKVRVAALPLIFSQFKERRKKPDEQTGFDLLEQVKIYNEVPKIQEKDWREALLYEYTGFLRRDL